MDMILQLTAVPIIAGIIAAALPDSRWSAKVAGFGSCLQVVVVLVILSPLLSSGRSIEPITGFYIDRISSCFLILTSVVSACALTQSRLFFAAEFGELKRLPHAHLRIYYACALWFVSSMLAVFMCNNLGYLWISIEATTLLSAALVYFNREKHAVEATWKYLIICSVGIAFALLGTILLFASSQHGATANGALNFTELAAVSGKLEPTLARLGFILCFLGYGTKAGMFPLHSWLPDAHSEAPAPASAMLSGSLLNCALFAIWRLSTIASGSGQHQFAPQLCIWSGATTVLAASLFLVRQRGLKRLWAYSSIENVGLMLAAIGLNSPLAFALQAINHSIVKVSLFLLSGTIIQHSGSKDLSEIKGVLTSAPAAGLLLSLSALAITGAPPFGAFISEWIILSNSADMNLWIPFVMITFGLALTFVAICVHIGRILIGAPGAIKGGSPSWKLSLIPAALLLCSLLLGVMIDPQMLGGLL
jgi:hydrogenase-4 component F